MRFLSFHVDKFTYKVTKRGRSSIIEEITDSNREQFVENALVLFLSVEKSDENDPSIIQKSIDEIKKISKQLKINSLMIMPFAHLFGELSSLNYSYKYIKELTAQLSIEGFEVKRAPFGYFNSIYMEAKGHPLSRISRRIN